MKLLVLTFLFLVGSLIFGAAIVAVAPYYYYNEFIYQKSPNNWFELDFYDKKILEPGQMEAIKSQKLSNENLWSKFHFGNLNIPLPVKNPFYLVSPKMEYDKSNDRTNFGLSINDSSNESLAQVYFLPMQYIPDLAQKQNAFALPLIKNRLENINPMALWQDTFSKDITEWNIPIEEMIYNLYILQFRSFLLNKKVLSYGFYGETNTAILKIDYKNKDFIGELVLNLRGNQIYSYFLVTKKDNLNATLIRKKMIEDMEYVPSSESLTKILYNEFQALPYKDKIDHIGMLYLLSAWSHQKNNRELLHTSIEFLEKGRGNISQLESLYLYYFNRYGLVFSRRFVKGLKLPSQIMLQLQIKREAEKNRVNVFNQIKKIDNRENLNDVKKSYEEIIEDTKKRQIKRRGLLRMD